MPFKRGQSGNPQGRRVECLPEIRELYVVAKYHMRNFSQNSEQAVNNGNLKPFKKGQSGNPGGRPKEVAEVRALARTTRPRFSMSPPLSQRWPKVTGSSRGRFARF